MRATAIAALALTAQTPAFAHEVDEYVQSALISLERDHLDVQIRLVPGADVFPQVFTGIDTNADGVLSDAEKQAYVRNVLSDLTFSMNGQPLAAQIVSTQFPSVDLMRQFFSRQHTTIVVFSSCFV